MLNLVPMRELIRNDTARGHSDNIGTTFARGGFDSPFESVIVRASLPYSPIDIATCFSVMGAKTIHARSRLAIDLLHFTRWCTNRVSKVLHIELTPSRYRPFSSALARVYLLAACTSPQLHEQARTKTIDAVTRPYALILRDRVARTRLPAATPTVRRKRKENTKKSRSPRSLVTFSGSSCSSTQRTYDTQSCSVRETCFSNDPPPAVAETQIPGTEPDDAYSVYSREKRD